jgi:hypothetical protein
MDSLSDMRAGHDTRLVMHLTPTGSFRKGKDIDELAKGCNLEQSVPGDPVHFEYRPKPEGEALWQ